MDWHEWHSDYDVPTSSLGRRLRVVQARVRTALDACRPGPVKALSVCAGQGRDLIEVLSEHPRREDVTARLVELDARNAAAARRAATAAELRHVDVVLGDAALTDHYDGMAPADLVLMCGVFGNLTEQDVKRTVAYCGQLCAHGATLLWTRRRKPPDLAPRICRWLEERGFERQWLSEPDAGTWAATPSGPRRLRTSQGDRHRAWRPKVSPA